MIIFPISTCSPQPRPCDFVDFISLPEILELEQRYKVVEMEGDL